MTAVRLGLGALWLVTAVAASVLVATAVTLTDAVQGDPSLALVLSCLAVVGLVFSSVGMVIAVRVPRNRIGLVLIATGPALILTFTGFVLAALLTARGGTADPWAGLWTWLAVMSFQATFALLGSIPLLFPDGRLPSTRWRWPVGGVLLTIATASLVSAFAPGPMQVELAENPLGIREPVLEAAAPIAAALGSIGILGFLALGVAALVSRFRGATSPVRQQGKWLLASVALVAVLLTLSIMDGANGVTLVDVLAFPSIGLIPIAIGIAVLRYRLYEIDRLISRTIGWALLTGLLLLTFSALVVGFQAVLEPVTDGSTLAVAGSTLAVAALFGPVRRRIQRMVDRHFDRSRYDGERLVDAFGIRLRDEVGLDAIHRDILGTVDVAVRPASMSLWVRG